jgi:hypothetical protein
LDASIFRIAHDIVYVVELSWMSKQQAAPKYRYMYSNLHGVILKKTGIFFSVVVRNSDIIKVPSTLM